MLVKDGQQICYGSYDEIITNSEFSAFINQPAAENAEQPVERRRRNSTNKFGSQVSLQPKLGRQDSVVFDDVNTVFDDSFLNAGEALRVQENEDEEMPKGGAGTYTRHMGKGLMFVVFLFLIAQGFYTFSDVFLKYWTAAAQTSGDSTDLNSINSNTTNNITETIRYELLKLTEEITNQTEADVNDGLDAAGRLMKRLSTSETAYAYSVIIVLLVVFSLSRSITFFRSCMKASISIHDTIFARLVRAPVSFFDKGMR